MCPADASSSRLRARTPWRGPFWCEDPGPFSGAPRAQDRPRPPSRRWTPRRSRSHFDVPCATNDHEGTGERAGEEQGGGQAPGGLDQATATRPGRMAGCAEPTCGCGVVRRSGSSRCGEWLHGGEGRSGDGAQRSHRLGDRLLPEALCRRPRTSPPPWGRHTRPWPAQGLRGACRARRPGPPLNCAVPCVLSAFSPSPRRARTRHRDEAPARFLTVGICPLCKSSHTCPTAARDSPAPERATPSRQGPSHTASQRTNRTGAAATSCAIWACEPLQAPIAEGLRRDPMPLGPFGSNSPVARRQIAAANPHSGPVCTTPGRRPRVAGPRGRRARRCALPALAAASVDGP